MKPLWLWLSVPAAVMWKKSTIPPRLQNNLNNNLRYIGQNVLQCSILSSLSLIVPVPRTIVLLDDGNIFSAVDEYNEDVALLREGDEVTYTKRTQ